MSLASVIFLSMSGSEEKTLGVLATNGARAGGTFSSLTDAGAGANAAEFPENLNCGGAAVLADEKTIGGDCDGDACDGRRGKGDAGAAPPAPPRIKRDAMPAITLRSLAAPPGAHAAIPVRGR